MNGPLAELHSTGRLGEQGIELLYRTVRRVAEADRIPSPEGHTTWDDEAVTEATHDLVVDHLLGRRRIDTLLLRATDEGSFEKLLWVTVQNYFRDVFRKTARGALARRLGELLQNGSQFRLWVPGPTRYGAASFWGLSSWSEPSPYQGEPSALVPAAFQIAGIRVVRWRPDATRRSPIADEPSLVRFLEGVLQAAQGLFSVPQLVEIASYRFGLLDSPAFVSLDEPSLQPTPPATHEPGPGELVAARAKAGHIYCQLSQRERQIVTRLGDNDYRTMGEELGLPKSTLFEAAQRLKAILHENLDPSDDAQLVLRELEAMCAATTD